MKKLLLLPLLLIMLSSCTGGRANIYGTEEASCINNEKMFSYGGMWRCEIPDHYCRFMCSRLFGYGNHGNSGEASVLACFNQCLERES